MKLRDNFTHGKVLFMDDEPAIRELASFMFGEIGWKVELVKNGTAALSVYSREKERGEPFDIVVLDVHIPGSAGGDKTLLSLLEVDPGIRAIVSSGQTNHPVMREYWKHGFSGALAKPYSIKELESELVKACSR